MATRRFTSDSTPEKIVERHLKGWQIMTSERRNLDSDAAPTSDSVMPSTEELRRKWSIDEPKKDRRSATPAVSDEGTSNVKVRSGQLEKSVGVNNGEVIWRQG
ncbi:hypothetical protein ACVIGV_004241 [Rhizobium leguminosarum]